jgi:uncharacterized protein YjcR
MQKCTATTAKGDPCKAWAVKGTEPPRCSAHAKRNVGAGAPAGNSNARKHGFYSRAYTLEELTAIGESAEITLDDEIQLLRVQLLRIGRYLKQKGKKLEARDYAALARITAPTARAIAALLRTKLIIESGNADEASAIENALDILSAEYGIKL